MHYLIAKINLLAANPRRKFLLSRGRRKSVRASLLLLREPHSLRILEETGAHQVGGGQLKPRASHAALVHALLASELRTWILLLIPSASSPSRPYLAHGLATDTECTNWRNAD